MPALRNALAGLVPLAVATLTLAFVPSANAVSTCLGGDSSGAYGGYGGSRANHAPLARFTSVALPDGTAALDASFSTDPDDDPLVAYRWNFGDGSPAVVSAAPQTVHHFAGAGTFTVTLTVTDCRDGQGSATAKVTLGVSSGPSVPVVTAAAVNDALGKSLKAFKPGHIATLLGAGFATGSFDAPGPGKIAFDWLTAPASTSRAAAAAKAKRRRVAHGARTVKSAGRVAVEIRLTRAGKKLLRRSKRLKVLVRATFTPTGGKPRSKTRRLTLRR